MDFSDLGPYPGSRESRWTVPSLPASAVEDDILGEGTIMVLRGRDVEFFTIGQLAAALNYLATEALDLIGCHASEIIVQGLT